MKNSRIFSEKLIPKRIQDYGVYLGSTGTSYGYNNSTNDKKTLKNKLKNLKNKIKNYDKSDKKVLRKKRTDKY